MAKQCEMDTYQRMTLTGQHFVVQRGAGLGVDPDRKDTTLFAHYYVKT